MEKIRSKSYNINCDYYKKDLHNMILQLKEIINDILKEDTLILCFSNIYSFIFLYVTLLLADI